MYLRHARALKSNNQRNAKSMFIPLGCKVLWRKMKINLASMLRRTIVVLNPHRLRTLAYRPHCVLGTRNVSRQGGQDSRQLIVCARGICRRGVFLARARVVDTFFTFKIKRRALLLSGIISHWRRDSSLETPEVFPPFSISSVETLILIYLKNISIYMRYTVLMQFSV